MTIEQKIQDALQRLTRGRPEITDGRLTITNLCTEAGISRASFYRSPTAEQIKKLINDPATPRPELEALRQQVKDLNSADKALRSQHANQVRELREQVKTYANHIQVLALHTSQLQDDNHRLLRHIEEAGENVTPLPSRR